MIKDAAEIARLRAELAATKAELGQAQAVVSASEAMMSMPIEFSPEVPNEKSPLGGIR
jgi:hypothetical protein